MLNKKIRQTGDNTREKILQASKKLFAKYGFSETSMDKIAKIAKVNQSLIFHHFKNKSNLWKLVKQSFLDKTSNQIFKENSNLKEFLEEIVFSRYYFYKKDPDIIRIMLWQKMELKRHQVFGANNISPQNWLPEIKKRQSNGMITKKIKAEYIVMMISGFLESILFPGGPELTLEQEKEYMKESIDGLVKILSII